MKVNLRQLWKSRASAFWKDAAQYLRIILSGYIYLPIMLLIMLAFLYQYILTEWSAASYTAYVGWIFALLFSLQLNFSRIRTFLSEPDAIYLLPLEDKMDKQYFRLSWFYSFVIQAFVLFTLMIVLSPLYSGMISADRGVFYVTYGIIALLAGFNLYAGFQERRLRQEGMKVVHTAGRWALNILFLAMLFKAYSFSFVVWGVVWTLAILYYYSIAKRMSWDWIDLVEIEQRQLLQFYQFAGWFMDVPHLPERVKKRKWLIFLLEKISLTSESAYTFLYLRSLARYQNIFTLYLRLLVIALLCMYFVNHLPLSSFLFIMFLLLNGVQLSGSWKRLQAYFWDAIYPVTDREKLTSFCRTIYSFLFLQTLLGSIALGVQQGWKAAVVMLIVGLLITYGYSYVILLRRLKKSLSKSPFH
ncbi:hypothetical protein BEP19_04575 [Ammoniphilus oxalaticus]|uniref:ABC transporter permease n=1 Tax=Ammoniphilus oxalaticus TaxID=66863 RepID=A0A419SM06_9BACL|nr:ABC transporter permease [Ammoniphilus oxalaticus]RKD25099.1 hypothetical protein BEP19_04575 [Ammoniphilus oxalaticus]